MLNVVKGVVVNIPDGDKPGLVKCGNGKNFEFSSKDLKEGYSPEPHDIVQVEEDDGKLLGMELYHRQGYVPPKEATVDLRLHCPYCGKRMVPKARKENGRVTETFCPECGKVLEEFPDESHQKKKTPPLQWALLILALILLALAFYFAD